MNVKTLKNKLFDLHKHTNVQLKQFTLSTSRNRKLSFNNIVNRTVCLVSLREVTYENEAGEGVTHVVVYFIENRHLYFADGGGELPRYYSQTRLPTCPRLFATDQQAEHNTCAVFVLMWTHLFVKGTSIRQIRALFRRCSTAILHDVCSRYMKTYHIRQWKIMNFHTATTQKSLKIYRQMYDIIGPKKMGRPKKQGGPDKSKLRSKRYRERLRNL